MIRRRVLARQLKLLREQSGLTLEQAAPKLDFSVSKLSRVENAQVMIDVHWVKNMLDICDAGGARWNELLDMAREAQQPGWWRAYGLGNNSYIAFETEARRVQVFQATYVPGQMQTAAYARALMLAVPVRRTEEQLDNEVDARVYRQQRLISSENPLEVVAVVDESALHRPIGGPDVLRRQLPHMAELAELPHGHPVRAPQLGRRSRGAGFGLQHPELRQPRRAGDGLRRAHGRRSHTRQGWRGGPG
jgi:transcriptional regulator with XRE-family HTH domain